MDIYTPPKLITVAAEPYCLLCRKKLPGSSAFGYRQRGVKYEDWEAKVLCVVCDPTEDPDASTKIHMFIEDLNILESHEDLVRAVQLPQVIHISFHPAVGTDFDRNRRPLFFVHLCCWKFVRHQQQQQHGYASSNNLDLYKLARLTQPILPPSYYMNSTVASQQTAPRTAIFPDDDDGNDGHHRLLGDTDLGRLFRACAARLPSELQQEVLRYLGGSLVSALLLTAQTAGSFPGLLLGRGDSRGQLFPSPARGVMTRRLIPNGGSANGDVWICGTTISLFGQSYLRRIEAVVADEEEDNGKGEASSSIRRVRVQSSAIQGVNFAVGIHGLQALRFSYRGGSTSPWIGDTGKDCWYGTVCGSDLGLLRVVQDDLKVIRVDFADIDDRSAATSASSAPWPQRALWDIPRAAPSYPQELQIVDAARCPSQLLHYPGFRLCQHLPLQQADGRYADGLTVHCGDGSIAGITAHFGESSSRTIGHRQGIPLHFRIQPRERITFVAVRTINAPDYAYFGPFLLIRTNLGRLAFFAPAIHRLMPNTTWSVLAPEDDCVVTGFILDPLTARGSHIQSVGAAFDNGFPHALFSDATGAPLTIPSLRAISNFMYANNHAHFSGAAVRDARKIQVRKVGSRCTGLCVHHDDGTVDVLGQWDPSSSSSSSLSLSLPMGEDAGSAKVVVVDIYDSAQDGPLKTLSFYYAGEGMFKSYITDIVVGCDGGEPEQRRPDHEVFVWRRSEHQALAWWFSISYDEVRPWDGALDELEVLDSHWRVTQILG